MSKIILAIAYLDNGGSERVVSLWADGLKARGHEVSIVLFHRIEKEYEIPSEIPVYALAETQREYEALSPITKYGKTRRLLKKLAPDYIISVLPASQCWMMVAGWGLRAHRIETLRNNPQYGISHIKPLFRFAWRVCFLTGRTIVLQTEGQLRYFGKRLQKKCVIVPNPVSERYATVYREVISEDPTRLIAVGRITPQKNYKLMVDVFSAVSRDRPSVTLCIFGEGKAEYKQEIQEYIAAKGMADRIRLMGRTPHIEEEYRKADIFLMTSDYEGLPNALMEAMASRLICVSADCDTGPGDLIEDGVTGFLAPVGDAAALAAAVNRALDMPVGERIRMADAARDKIMGQYSLENSIDRLCRCFKD